MKNRICGSVFGFNNEGFFGVASSKDYAEAAALNGGNGSDGSALRLSPRRAKQWVCGLALAMVGAAMVGDEARATSAPQLIVGDSVQGSVMSVRETPLTLSVGTVSATVASSELTVLKPATVHLSPMLRDNVRASLVIGATTLDAGESRVFSVDTEMVLIVDVAREFGDIAATIAVTEARLSSTRYVVVRHSIPRPLPTLFAEAPQVDGVYVLTINPARIREAPERLRDRQVLASIDYDGIEEWTESIDSLVLSEASSGVTSVEDLLPDNRHDNDVLRRPGLFAEVTTRIADDSELVVALTYPSESFPASLPDTYPNGRIEGVARVTLGAGDSALIFSLPFRILFDGTNFEPRATLVNTSLNLVEDQAEVPDLLFARVGDDDGTTLMIDLAALDGSDAIWRVEPTLPAGVTTDANGALGDLVLSGGELAANATGAWTARVSIVDELKRLDIVGRPEDLAANTVFVGEITISVSPRNDAPLWRTDGEYSIGLVEDDDLDDLEADELVVLRGLASGDANEAFSQLSVELINVGLRDGNVNSVDELFTRFAINQEGTIARIDFSTPTSNNYGTVTATVVLHDFGDAALADNEVFSLQVAVVTVGVEEVADPFTFELIQRSAVSIARDADATLVTLARVRPGDADISALRMRQNVSAEGFDLPIDARLWRTQTLLQPTLTDEGFIYLILHPRPSGLEDQWGAVFTLFNGTMQTDYTMALQVAITEPRDTEYGRIDIGLQPEVNYGGTLFFPESRDGGEDNRVTLTAAFTVLYDGLPLADPEQSNRPTIRFEVDGVNVASDGTLEIATPDADAGGERDASVVSDAQTLTLEYSFAPPANDEVFLPQRVTAFVQGTVTSDDCTNYNEVGSSIEQRFRCTTRGRRPVVFARLDVNTRVQQAFGDAVYIAPNVDVIVAEDQGVDLAASGTPTGIDDVFLNFFDLETFRDVASFAAAELYRTSGFSPVVEWGYELLPHPDANGVQLDANNFFEVAPVLTNAIELVDPAELRNIVRDFPQADLGLVFRPRPNAYGVLLVSATIRSLGGHAYTPPATLSVTLQATVQPVNDPPQLANLIRNEIRLQSGDRAQRYTVAEINPGEFERGMRFGDSSIVAYTFEDDDGQSRVVRPGVASSPLDGLDALLMPNIVDQRWLVVDVAGVPATGLSGAGARVRNLIIEDDGGNLFATGGNPLTESVRYPEPRTTIRATLRVTVADTEETRSSYTPTTEPFALTAILTQGESTRLTVARNLVGEGLSVQIENVPISFSDTRADDASPEALGWVEDGRIFVTVRAPAETRNTIHSRERVVLVDADGVTARVATISVRVLPLIEPPTLRVRGAHLADGTLDALADFSDIEFVVDSDAGASDDIATLEIVSRGNIALLQARNGDLTTHATIRGREDRNVRLRREDLLAAGFGASSTAFEVTIELSDEIAMRATTLTLRHVDATALRGLPRVDAGLLQGARAVVDEDAAAISLTFSVELADDGAELVATRGGNDRVRDGNVEALSDLFEDISLQTRCVNCASSTDTRVYMVTLSARPLPDAYGEWRVPIYLSDDGVAAANLEISATLRVESVDDSLAFTPPSSSPIELIDGELRVLSLAVVRNGGEPFIVNRPTASSGLENWQFDVGVNPANRILLTVRVPQGVSGTRLVTIVVVDPQSTESRGYVVPLRVREVIEPPRFTAPPIISRTYADRSLLVIRIIDDLVIDDSHLNALEFDAVFQKSDAIDVEGAITRPAIVDFPDAPSVTFDIAAGDRDVDVTIDPDSLEDESTLNFFFNIDGVRHFVTQLRLTASSADMSNRPPQGQLYFSRLAYPDADPLVVSPDASDNNEYVAYTVGGAVEETGFFINGVSGEFFAGVNDGQRAYARRHARANVGPGILIVSMLTGDSLVVSKPMADGSGFGDIATLRPGSGALTVTADVVDSDGLYAIEVRPLADSLVRLGFSRTTETQIVPILNGAFPGGFNGEVVSVSLLDEMFTATLIDTGRGGGNEVSLEFDGATVALGADPVPGNAGSGNLTLHLTTPPSGGFLTTVSLAPTAPRAGVWVEDAVGVSRAYIVGEASDSEGDAVTVRFDAARPIGDNNLAGDAAALWNGAPELLLSPGGLIILQLPPLAAGRYGGWEATVVAADGSAAERDTILGVIALGVSSANDDPTIAVLTEARDVDETTDQPTPRATITLTPGGLNIETVIASVNPGPFEPGDNITVNVRSASMSVNDEDTSLFAEPVSVGYDAPYITLASNTRNGGAYGEWVGTIVVVDNMDNRIAEATMVLTIVVPPINLAPTLYAVADIQEPTFDEDATDVLDASECALGMAPFVGVARTTCEVARVRDPENGAMTVSVRALPLVDANVRAPSDLLDVNVILDSRDGGGMMVHSAVVANIAAPKPDAAGVWRGEIVVWDDGLPAGNTDGLGAPQTITLGTLTISVNAVNDAPRWVELSPSLPPAFVVSLDNDPAPLALNIGAVRDIEGDPITLRVGDITRVPTSSGGEVSLWSGAVPRAVLRGSSVYLETDEGLSPGINAVIALNIYALDDSGAETRLCVRGGGIVPCVSADDPNEMRLVIRWRNSPPDFTPTESLATVLVGGQATEFTVARDVTKGEGNENNEGEAVSLVLSTPRVILGNIEPSDLSIADASIGADGEIAGRVLGFGVTASADAVLRITAPADASTGVVIYSAELRNTYNFGGGAAEPTTTIGEVTLVVASDATPHYVITPRHLTYNLNEVAPGETPAQRVSVLGFDNNGAEDVAIELVNAEVVGENNNVDAVDELFAVAPSLIRATPLADNRLSLSLGAPAANRYGVYRATIAARDAAEIETMALVTISVTPNNDAPIWAAVRARVIAIAESKPTWTEVTLAEVNAGVLESSQNLTADIVDAGASGIVAALVNQGMTTFVRRDGAATVVVAVLPPPDDVYGNAMFSVRLRDDGAPMASSATEVFNVAIAPDNDPPTFVLSGLGLTLNEGASTEFEIASGVTPGAFETGQSVSVVVVASAVLADSGNVAAFDELVSVDLRIDSSNRLVAAVDAIGDANGVAWLDLVLRDDFAPVEETVIGRMVINARAVNDPPAAQAYDLRYVFNVNHRDPLALTIARGVSGGPLEDDEGVTIVFLDEVGFTEDPDTGEVEFIQDIVFAEPSVVAENSDLVALTEIGANAVVGEYLLEFDLIDDAGQIAELNVTISLVDAVETPPWFDNDFIALADSSTANTVTLVLRENGPGAEVPIVNSVYPGLAASRLRPSFENIDATVNGARVVGYEGLLSGVAFVPELIDIERSLARALSLSIGAPLAHRYGQVRGDIFVDNERNNGRVAVGHLIVRVEENDNPLSYARAQQRVTLEEDQATRARVTVARNLDPGEGEHLEQNVLAFLVADRAGGGTPPVPFVYTDGVLALEVNALSEVILDVSTPRAHATGEMTVSVVLVDSSLNSADFLAACGADCEAVLRGQAAANQFEVVIEVTPTNDRPTWVVGALDALTGANALAEDCGVTPSATTPVVGRFRNVACGARAVAEHRGAPFLERLDAGVVLATIATDLAAGGIGESLAALSARIDFSRSSVSGSRVRGRGIAGDGSAVEGAGDFLFDPRQLFVNLRVSIAGQRLLLLADGLRLDANGTMTLHVDLFDHGEAGEEAFQDGFSVTVAVDEVNDPPTFEVVTGFEYTYDEDYADDLTLELATRIYDPDGDAFTLVTTSTGTPGLWREEPVAMLFTEQSSEPLDGAPQRDIDLVLIRQELVLQGGEFNADAFGAWTLDATLAEVSVSGRTPTYQPYRVALSDAVEIGDEARASQNREVTISVRPVNDAPSFALAERNITTAEDSPPFSITVTNISAGPPNEAGQDLVVHVRYGDVSLSHTLNGGDSEETGIPGVLRAVAVNSASGDAATIAFTLRDHRFGRASLSVWVQDGGAPPRDSILTATVHINVTAVTDEPRIRGVTDLIVSEDSGRTTLPISITLTGRLGENEGGVVQLALNDAGIQNIALLALRDAARGTGEPASTLSFSLSQDERQSSQVVLPAELVLETTPNRYFDAPHEITLRAFWQHNQSVLVTAVADISVVNVNDPPAFVLPASYELTEEQRDNGRVRLSITLTDLTPGPFEREAVNYTISPATVSVETTIPATGGRSMRVIDWGADFGVFTHESGGQVRRAALADSSIVVVLTAAATAEIEHFHGEFTLTVTAEDVPDAGTRGSSFRVTHEAVIRITPQNDAVVVSAGRVSASITDEDPFAVYEAALSRLASNQDRSRFTVCGTDRARLDAIAAALTAEFEESLTAPANIDDLLVGSSACQADLSFEVAAAASDVVDEVDDVRVDVVDFPDALLDEVLVYPRSADIAAAATQITVVNTADTNRFLPVQFVFAPRRDRYGVGTITFRISDLSTSGVVMTSVDYTYTLTLRASDDTPTIRGLEAATLRLTPDSSAMISEASTPRIADVDIDARAHVYAPSENRISSQQREVRIVFSLRGAGGRSGDDDITRYVTLSNNAPNINVTRTADYELTVTASVRDEATVEAIIGALQVRDRFFKNADVARTIDIRYHDGSHASFEASAALRTSAYRDGASLVDVGPVSPVASVLVVSSDRSTPVLGAEGHDSLRVALVAPDAESDGVGARSNRVVVSWQAVEADSLAVASSGTAVANDGARHEWISYRLYVGKAGLNDESLARMRAAIRAPVESRASLLPGFWWGKRSWLAVTLEDGFSGPGLDFGDDLTVTLSRRDLSLAPEGDYTFRLEACDAGGNCVLYSGARLVTMPAARDTDRDGVPDDVETLIGGDLDRQRANDETQIVDAVEAYCGGNYYADTDGDGMPNNVEVSLGTDCRRALESDYVGNARPVLTAAPVNADGRGVETAINPRITCEHCVTARAYRKPESGACSASVPGNYASECRLIGDERYVFAPVGESAVWWLATDRHGNWAVAAGAFELEAQANDPPLSSLLPEQNYTVAALVDLGADLVVGVGETNLFITVASYGAAAVLDNLGLRVYDAENAVVSMSAISLNTMAQSGAITYYFGNLLVTLGLNERAEINLPALPDGFVAGKATLTLTPSEGLPPNIRADLISNNRPQAALWMDNLNDHSVILDVSDVDSEIAAVVTRSWYEYADGARRVTVGLVESALTPSRTDIRVPLAMAMSSTEATFTAEELQRAQTLVVVAEVATTETFTDADEPRAVRLVTRNYFTYPILRTTSLTAFEDIDEDGVPGDDGAAVLQSGAGANRNLVAQPGVALALGDFARAVFGAAEVAQSGIAVSALNDLHGVLPPPSAAPDDTIHDFRIVLPTSRGAALIAIPLARALTRENMFYYRYSNDMGGWLPYLLSGDAGDDAVRWAPALLDGDGNPVSGCPAPSLTDAWRESPQVGDACVLLRLVDEGRNDLNEFPFAGGSALASSRAEPERAGVINAVTFPVGQFISNPQPTGSSSSGSGSVGVWGVLLLAIIALTGLARRRAAWRMARRGSC